MLAIPVPVSGEVVSTARLRARLAGVERRLDGQTDVRAREARARACAACLLLSDGTRQRAKAQELITRGLKPTTSEVECPVNRRALERYVARAGADADVMQLDKRGRPRGTLRELVQAFLVRLHGRDSVRLQYQHSLLGAELVSAGFVLASREYAYGGQADPFRLPRAVREVALARRGHDMDDSASYPRACLDVFRTGKAESRVFLSGVTLG